MKPDEQQRVQERMREWVKLTPEQRRIVRENYATAKKLDSSQKSEHWQKYQELPEEQKKKLAADNASKKHVITRLPTSQNRSKTVPPIKSTPKPVLEQSVTPQATTQSPLQPVHQSQPK
jgi:sortase (surface protein transpeptidase)